MLFDHGSGHFIPREPKTLSELTATITAMTEQAEASFSSQSDTESISEIRKSIDGFSMLSDDCSSASSVDSGDYGDEKS